MGLLVFNAFVSKVLRGDGKADVHIAPASSDRE